MEKRTCKLCFRTFSNGRALGGHMRSHLRTLSPSPHTQKTQLENGPSSSQEEEQDQEEEGKAQYYGLRENPKKSIRLVDPEFFSIDANSVVQDRESETESSKNPFRRPSKKHRKSAESTHQIMTKTEPDTELEPVSSVSDTTPEEDVALCLMMLSRDIWMRESDDSDELGEFKFITKGRRSKYQCGTCKKVFKSYQALGGHRASHKKIGCCKNTSSLISKIQEDDEGRIHECPICFRVFSSGQALGGHKRSHVSVPATVVTSSAKFRDNFIDLNLPAPLEDDEFSVVSDPEFVDPAK
ncbi:C2H2-like zinc finger protein [Tasmannia lanceolata]|uniref:C2H2-like zinc finger protein n=1 Tax=Tasmannia lanceolata TaxID=3420 RepID=UPI0040642AE5